MSNSVQQAEVDGGHLTYKAALFQYIEPVIASHPHNPAVIVAHQKRDYLREFTRSAASSCDLNADSACLVWTYEQMQHAALKLVASLQARNVGPGSRVATLIPNGIECALLLWSSLLGKFTLCPLDVGALQSARADELHNLMNLLQPDAIFVPENDGANAVDTALHSSSNTKITKIILAADPERIGWVSINSLAMNEVNDDTASRIIAEAQHDDLDRTQLILFTSGTTSGKPKGCPRTVRSTKHTMTAQTWGSWNDTTARNALQSANFRIIAPALALGTWAYGACNVMPDVSFSPDTMLEAIEVHKLRYILLIPAMVHALTEHAKFKTTNMTSLRSVNIGGDMITEGLYRKTCAAFPNCEVQVSHGSTEGGSAFSHEYAAMTGPQPLPFLAGIAPLGKVARGTRLRIANEQNAVVNKGETGELHFCAPSFVTRYLDGEQPEAFYTDGYGSWFKSGDMGMIDKDGWVYITGRKKDIIKRAGVPISPAALESCIDIMLHSQCSVLAISHERLGQEPFAVVSSLNGFSKSEVKRQIVNVFSKDYALGGVATLKELGLDTFPLNATGKILKRDLEAPVSAFLNNQ